MKSVYAPLALLALLLVGCSGNGDQTDGFGEVTGIIFDEEGVPVRDAHVYFDGPGNTHANAQTNSNGVYVLTGVPQGDQVVRAELPLNGGLRYYGQNVARVSRGDRVMNHNIAVYRDDRLAEIEGFVSDRQGFKLQGARVFVKQRAANTVLSSAYGITDGDGHYRVQGLRANQDYNIQVNARDYNSDFDIVNLGVHESRRLDFTLPNAEEVVLDPPTNVDATAWTSPRVRSANWGSVLETMKSIIKPGRKAKASTRTTSGGNIVEVDVLWDPINGDPALLGYGIYRSDNGGQLRDIYFLRDPLAEIFADMDDVLHENRSYTYRMTTITSIDAESDFSADPGPGQRDPATVKPLGDLVLGTASATRRPTFRWEPAIGAGRYVVYLFNAYPHIGASDIWNNESDPTSGSSYTYSGGDLAPGRYFYIVVGMAGDGVFTDYTLSPVGEINVP